MPTVAEQLRQAREQQSLNIYQVAEITKIKTDHIRALESGQYDSFSAPVYIRGFVRTYGRALKMDEGKLMANLEAELRQTDGFSEPPPLTKPTSGFLDFLMLQFSKMSWRTVIGLAVVVTVLLAGGGILRQCRSQAKSDPLKALGPGLYQPPKGAQSGEILPLPTNSPRR